MADLVDHRFFVVSHSSLYCREREREGEGEGERGRKGEREREKNREKVIEREKIK